MSEGNGSIASALARVGVIEDEQAELRDEIRLMRKEMSDLKSVMRDTGRAVDTLLAELRLRDVHSDE